MPNSPLSLIDAALNASIAQVNETGASAQRAAPARRLEDAARFAGIALTALLSGGEEPMVSVRIGLQPQDFDEFDEGDAIVQLGGFEITIAIMAVPPHVNAAPGELLLPLMLYLTARAYVSAQRERDEAFLRDLPDAARSMMEDALAAPAQHIAAARRRLGN